MKKTFFLHENMIFRSMSEEEVTKALDYLCATTKQYRKHTTILHAGSLTACMGFIQNGSVTIENIDLFGNRTILNHIGKNEFFAETYALLEEPVLVNVVANETTTILFLRIGKLGTIDYKQNPWAAKLLHNLLTITAHKNLALSARSFHTSPKTIRTRVLSYLHHVAVQTKTTEFDIPFNRQQMADYLNVERTALSKELRKMKEDHLIQYRKNHFKLYTNM